MTLQTAEQPDLTTGIAAKPRGAPAMECAAVFLLSLGLMLWIQFASPAIIGNDAYYHIRWSRMLRESFSQGLHLPAFNWLPLTVLRASDFVDQHFLFHVALMPFTFGDLRVGAKLAAPLFAALGITSLFALLAVYRVRYRWLWLLPLLAGSEPFLYRMSMTRAPALSLVILAAAAYLILERKFVPLAALAFVFVWLYNMFPLILAFAVAYAVAAWLADRRIDLRALYATAIGAALGLLVNPYFPKDLLLLAHHARMLLADTATIDVGSEWYPFDTWELLAGNALIFALCFVALLAFDWPFSRRAAGARGNSLGSLAQTAGEKTRATADKPSETTGVVSKRGALFFLLVAAGLLFMGLRWRRFVEYWPPFLVLFAAFTFDAEPLEWPRRISMTTTTAVLALVMAAIGVVNVRGARAEIRETDNPNAMRGATMWLAEHTPAGSMVFNVDWAEFTELFYYDQHNVYVSGLDPRYLYDAQPELWKAYDSITSGTETHPGPLIRQRFGAEYVVARSDSTDFLSAAKASGDFDTVFSDDYAVILRVR